MEIADLLKAGGRALIAEPKERESHAEFKETVIIAVKAGLRMVNSPKIAGTRAVLIKKD